MTGLTLTLLGATVFVDGSNGGCSDGTYLAAQSEATPLCTLQAAADLAQSGDTVRVKAGTYTEGSALRVHVDGTTWRPFGNGPVIIVGPAVRSGGDTDHGLYVTASNVVIEGFEIRGAAHDGIRVEGSNVTLRGNRVHENGRGCGPSFGAPCGQGIAANSTSPRTVGVVLENNVSYDNGSGELDHCYYISGVGTRVQNNVALRCAGYGFQIYPNCDDCIVVNNLAANQPVKSGFIFGGEAGSTGTSAALRAMNNISINNGDQGYHLRNNADAGITLKNNLAFNNAGGALDVTDTATVYSSTGLMTADPRLRDLAAMDFHLLPGSPAVDMGTSELYAPVDLDGEPRPIGAGVDLGVDEFSDGGPAPAGDAGAASDAGVTTDAGTGGEIAGRCGCGSSPGSAAVLLFVVLLGRGRSRRSKARAQR